MEKNMWCLLLHLSYNMWEDSPTRKAATNEKFELELEFDKSAWDEVTEMAVKEGCNSVLIDLGDGVKYKSHPEIAVEGAWEPEYLKAELKRLREMGLTPYPKLNFSAGHDAWLGVYSRMLSTPIYYEVVRDLIHEVIDIFDTPELFHLGLDEENGLNQSKLDFACVRQYDLIWHDLNFYFDCVREKGVRPWIWADYEWSYPEEFMANVPKDVLISPWYYNHLYSDKGAPFPMDAWSVARRESFKKLSDEGYDVLPTGSNITNIYNLDHMVRYSAEQVAPEHNKGLVIAPWVSTIERCKYRIMDAIHLAYDVKKKYFGE